MVELVTPNNNRKYPGSPWRVAIHVSLGALVAFVVQSVGVIVVLVQMHSDVAQLKLDHAGMEARISAIDSGGTRELALIRQRQQDLTASQGAQDARISELYARTGKTEQQANESRFWVEQLRDLVKAFAHPPTTRP